MKARTVNVVARIIVESSCVFEVEAECAAAFNSKRVCANLDCEKDYAYVERRNHRHLAQQLNPPYANIPFVPHQNFLQGYEVHDCCAAKGNVRLISVMILRREIVGPVGVTPQHLQRMCSSSSS